MSEASAVRPGIGGSAGRGTVSLDVAMRGSRCPAPRGACPAPGGEFLYAIAGDEDPFGAQQLALELKVAAEAAQTSAGRDHPMTWYRLRSAFPHDVPDRARRSRAARRRGDVAVGGHPARRDAPDDGEDFRAERTRDRHH